jgi:hypothetical protein
LAHQNISLYFLQSLVSKRKDLDIISALIVRASRDKRFDLLQFCLVNGSTDNIRELFIQACKFNLQYFCKIIYYRLDGGNVDFLCKLHGSTALMHASQMGNVEIVQWLLLKGADPELKGRSRMTARNFASLLEHKKTKELITDMLLVAKGLCDANRDNITGKIDEKKEKKECDTIGDNIEKGKQKEKGGTISDHPPGEDYRDQLISFIVESDVISAIEKIELLRNLKRSGPKV